MRDILFIRTDTEAAERLPLPEGTALLGGRALAATLAEMFHPPAASALSPASALVLAPGLLSELPLPADRLSIAGKSPVTKRLKISDASGTPGPALAAWGIAAVVFTGAATAPVDIIISGDSARIAPSLAAGLNIGEALPRLQAAHPKGSAFLFTGRAGERLLPLAGIGASRDGGFKVAGRDGLGALMGAKGIKAVIIHPNETPCSHTGTALAIRRAFAEYFPQSGAAAETGGCLFPCGKACRHGAEAGQKPDAAEKWPGYREHWAEGNSSKEHVARFAALCDDMGLDAFAAARALIAAKQAGLAPKRGAEGAFALLEETDAGTPLGLRLGKGGVGEDVSSRGTPGGSAAVPMRSEKSKETDLAAACLDSLGMCRFLAPRLRLHPSLYEVLAEAANAVHNSKAGTLFTAASIADMGRCAAAAEDAFNSASLSD